jgi:hypothetical protein
MKSTAAICLISSLLCIGMGVCAPKESEQKLDAKAVLTEAQIAEIKADLTDLHSAMIKYLAAHAGVWPQMPEALLETTEGNELLQWWIDILKAQGAKDESFRFSGAKDDFLMSYLPTNFEDTPMIAYCWRSMPWFGATFQPAYVIFPEGVVKSAQELLAHFPGHDRPPEFAGMIPVEKVPQDLRGLFQKALPEFEKKNAESERRRKSLRLDRSSNNKP